MGSLGYDRREMAYRVPIPIRLESFEGPLDLLLYLIQCNELDISNISITRITDQYLAYVKLMQELNFDMASEFLVMAATLLLWKSRALLPNDEEAEGANANGDDGFITQEELLRRLKDLQLFQQAGRDLAQLPRMNEDVFTRPAQRPPIERIWKEMNLTDLTTCYQTAMANAQRRTKVLRKETVSLSVKIAEFNGRLKVGELTNLKQLFSVIPSRADTVVTFLASLELGKLKKMKLFQEEAYRDIYVELLETLANLDTSFLSEFDGPQAQNAESPTAAPELPEAALAGGGDAPAPDAAPA